MWKKKKINKAFPAVIFSILLIALFIGGGLLAAEENKQKGASAEDAEIPTDEKIPNTEVDEAPANFIATEEVSADQAVAFPTDI